MELPDLFTSQLAAKALEGMTLAGAVIQGLIQ
jgi:hypothetical protein